VVEPIVRTRIGLDIRGIVDANELVRDDTDRNSEEMIDRPHPATADPRQVVVRRDEVTTAAQEGVEVERQGRHERLSFAGLHLGDLALVQHDTGHQLHVEVTHVEGSPRSLAHGRERLDQDVVECLAVLEPRLEFVGLGTQLLVAEPLVFRFQRVDLIDDPAQALQLSLVRVAENLLEDISHGLVSRNRTERMR